MVKELSTGNAAWDHTAEKPTHSQPVKNIRRMLRVIKVIKILPLNEATCFGQDDDGLNDFLIAKGGHIEEHIEKVDIGALFFKIIAKLAASFVHLQRFFFSVGQTHSVGCCNLFGPPLHRRLKFYMQRFFKVLGDGLGCPSHNNHMPFGRDIINEACNGVFNFYIAGVKLIGEKQRKVFEKAPCAVIG